MKDILGHAIHDYYHKTHPAELWINNLYGPKEEMPVEVYFRSDDEMPDAELLALNLCQGKVLDIGAGAGSHALLLQQKGMDVTALDISAMAVAVMKARGVAKALEADIFNYNQHQYDTLLLLMNGIGLCGTLDGLRTFLRHALTLLKPGGQLVFDSSDIAYLYEGDLPENKNYYGELAYQYEYKEQKTGWFNWLYIDEQSLKSIAAEEGWQTSIVYQDEFDHYLAVLRPPHA